MADDAAVTLDGTGCDIGVERPSGPYRSANRTPSPTSPAARSANSPSRRPC